MTVCSPYVRQQTYVHSYESRTYRPADFIDFITLSVARRLGGRPVEERGAANQFVADTLLTTYRSRMKSPASREKKNGDASSNKKPKDHPYDFVQCDLPGCEVATGLRRCTRCHCVAYCSVEHQKEHWSKMSMQSKHMHKLVCKNMKLIRDEGQSMRASGKHMDCSYRSRSKRRRLCGACTKGWKYPRASPPSAA